MTRRRQPRRAGRSAFPGLRRPALRLCLASLVLLGSAGCALFYQSPSVRIVDVRVVGLGFTGGTAEVILEVDNPNRFGLEVRGFDYLLEVGDHRNEARWDTLAHGTAADTVQLPRRSVEEVRLRIPFRYRALDTAFRAWMDGGEIPYQLHGELRARGPGGQRDLPFRSRGSLTP
jgi:LEA14-like dessication related protein